VPLGDCVVEIVGVRDGVPEIELEEELLIVDEVLMLLVPDGLACAEALIVLVRVCVGVGVSELVVEILPELEILAEELPDGVCEIVPVGLFVVVMDDVCDEVGVVDLDTVILGEPEILGEFDTDPVNDLDPDTLAVRELLDDCDIDPVIDILDVCELLPVSELDGVREFEILDDAEAGRLEGVLLGDTEILGVTGSAPQSELVTPYPIDVKTSQVNLPGA